METAVGQLVINIKAKGAHVRKPQPPPSMPVTAIGRVSVQQTAGNLAIQKLFDAEPQKREAAITPPTPAKVDEGESKESAVEVDEAKKGVTPLETAPPRPEEDPAHQAVVKQLAIKAKKQRTPTKTAEQKQAETVLAGNLPAETIKKEEADKNDLKKLGGVPPLTVEGFMTEFDKTVEKLTKVIPEKKEGDSPKDYDAWESKREQAVEDLGAGQEMAKQEVVKQQKTHSDLYRRDKAVSAQASTGIEEAESNLKLDPVGTKPTIQHAKIAAPKPKSEKAVSLDEQSRALDDSLVGHNVGGQTINIDEASLAFPISGEKTFDEAGETKRRAQEEIVKAKPKYREQEKGIVSNSEKDIHGLVNTTALQRQHAIRAQEFKGVLGAQELHSGRIKKEKKSAFDVLEKEYEDTKVKVNEELDKLKPEKIDELLQDILKRAEDEFASWVRTNLEYVYTPGILDYSDWIGNHRAEIGRTAKEIAKDSDDSDMIAGMKALRIVQDKSAADYFQTAKAIFIYNVRKEVEEKIAKLVVDALNAARGHITQGIAKVEKAYDGLPENEKKEAAGVKDAVLDKFKALDESVIETQHEVITDMARTYNQSVGKLQAKFDEIKKDVLTGWLERAWNKIKAVVNAIIEFATRLFQLLARVAGLAGDIISSPRAFFRNLAAGISEGFSTFIGDIDEYLATAFFDWLRGSSGVRVQLPKDWGPKGIFSLFTQLLNLSLETVWERMEVVYDKTIANAFRRGEVLLDKGLEIFGIIKNEGLGGLWDHIVESLGTILDDTLEMIKETVLYAAIKKIIFEIGKMLVPGGGFIAIAEKIIRLVTFLVEARDKILDLIESFIAAMEKAVSGDIAGIVKMITGALTKFITVALDFLVAFFSLGSLKEKVERFIERMRKPIIRGIDWVLEKFKPLVMKGKELFEKGKEKVVEAGKAVAQAGLPKDPNERLRLAARAAVSAASRLTGRVTQGLLNPILGGIKLRYGLTALEPFERSETWWVRATINPALDQDLGVSSAVAVVTPPAAQPPPLTVGTILAVNRPMGPVRGVFVGYGEDAKLADGSKDRTVRIAIAREERRFTFRGFGVSWFIPPANTTPPPVVQYTSSNFPFIHRNIKKAIGIGHPSRLQYLEDSAKADANRRAALANHKPAKSGFSLDEYPFASTYQGGAGAEVAEVPSVEQGRQGNLMKTFYQNNKLQDGDWFDVLV